MSTFDPTTDTSTSYTLIPPDYFASLETVAPTITDKITQQAAPGESWMDSLARLLPILAATNQQRQLLQTQADRAKAGLPPLDVSQYGAGVQIGLSADTKKLLMIGAAALGAILIFSRSR